MTIKGNDDIDVSYVDSTTKQANIKLVTKEITVFVNEYGKPTPILIVARATLDNTEYGALFDTSTKKAYVIEIIREMGQIKYFRDLDGIGQDEEWAIISNYFLKEKVYENNRISLWIWNTMQKHRRGLKPKGLKLKRKTYS